MTTSYYLVINGIAGDYSDALLTGAFQVVSFNDTITNAATLSGPGPTTFDPLHLRLTTQALAGLLAASANGTLTNVSLVGETTVNGAPTISYSLNLDDVILSDVSAGGASADVTLSYNQIGLVTTGFNADGSPQPSQSFGYDILQGQSTGPGTSLTSAGSPAIAPTAPTSYFLLIDGMNGDVTQKSHFGWFNLSSFSIGLANTTDPLNLAAGAHDAFSPLSAGFGGETGLVQLLQQEASGKLLTGVRIEGVDATGEAVYDLNLANVLVTHVGNQSSVNLDYQQVSLVTKGQDNSGALVETGSFGWDRTTNTSIDPATMPTIAAGTDHGGVAPTSYYLVIGGIAGGYTDKLVTGAFKLNSVSEDSVNSGSALTGPGTTAFGPLQLTLDNDQAIAALLEASASGKDIKNVSIVGESSTAGNSAITYSLNLANVIVSDIPANDGANSLTLKYGQIGLVTKGVDSSGALQTAQTFGWDAQTKTTTGPGLSLTTAGSAAVPPSVPSTYYLLIGGMNGGATAVNHQGWFRLNNFSFNLANTTDPLDRAAGGQAAFGQLSLTIHQDAALTALLQQAADGKLLTGLRIEGVTSTDQAVYDLNLADVLITGLGIGASPGGAAHDTISLTLDYGKISLVTEGQQSTGTFVQTGSFGWDTVKGSSIDPATMPSISPGTDHGAVAPTSYYLVIDGIAGDYSDKLVAGAFSVESFADSVKDGGSVALGADKPDFGALNLLLDTETLAGLLTAWANATVIKDVSVVGTSTVNGLPTITYSLNLGNVLVGAVAQSGTDRFASVTLDYNQIGLITKGVDTTGALQAAQNFGWDITNNASTGPGTSLTRAGSSAVAPTVPTKYYLLIDGINGGSTDNAHPDWFAISSFTIGLSNTTSVGGANHFADLSVAMPSETGLSQLLATEANGNVLKGIRVEGVDANGHAVYDLNLAHALVTGVDENNSDGFNVRFNYQDISLVTEGQQRFGNYVQTGSFGWDVVDNKSFNPADMPSISPCYCPGTLILTTRGEVPVENLAIGDVVVTMSGAARSIKWIGRRGYIGRFAQGKKDILPVCIKAGAIETDVPRRDLWISPHHAMYLEGVLIEAIDLVNGVTIVQAEEIEKVEYFHIELESHDVLIAEGSLSESYVDDDNRGLFHNAHEYAARDEEASGPARYCAPRLGEGYQVEAVRRHLALRAGLPAVAGEGSGELRGYVDEISFGRIAGWAQNVDHPEAPVCLDIYVDGELIGQALANRYRDDLERAGLGSGRHGFEFVPPAGVNVAAAEVEVRRSLDHAQLMPSQDGIRAAAA